MELLANVFLSGLDKKFGK